MSTSHTTEPAQETTVLRGPGFAPLSTEIPVAPPAPGDGTLPIAQGPSTPQPPEPAPMTTDARARARYVRSPQVTSILRTIRLAAWWSVVALGVVAITLVADSLIRVERTPPRAYTPPPPPVEPVAVRPPQRREHARALVEEGDRWLSRDAARAEQSFRDALTLDPTNAAANFGLGVTMLQRNAVDDAAPYLCAAQRTAVGPLSRDVQQLLDDRALTCP